jgi:sigma-B regulation protein RsbU (phosphoserine phosphatase)
MSERIIVDRISTRKRMLLLVFGSLMFVATSMGVYAVAEANRNATRFDERLAQFPDARAIYLLARNETQEGSARMGATATLLMALTLASGLYASRGIVRRLRELREAAQRIAAGDLDSPVPIEAHTELDHLAFALDHMRHDLRKVVALSLLNARIERDLAVASTVQAMFLPSEEITVTRHVTLSGFCRPATQCGGDFWWQKTLEDGTTLILVGDVTGHGTGPAMITASVAGALHTLIGDGRNLALPTLLSELNRSLERTCAGQFFMTLCALAIDPIAKQLRCYQAGAPPVLTMDSEGNVDVIAASGTRLGEHAPSFGEHVLPLRPGTRLLCFTDGLTERTLPGGHTFGLRRLRRAFAAGRAQPLADAALALRNELCAELDTSPLEDDMTFVMVELDPHALERRA